MPDTEDMSSPPLLAASLSSLPSTTTTTGRRPLRAAATAWFAVSVVGQLFFAAYVAAFYGSALLAGAPERWNQVLKHGYIAGDPVGNTVVGLHVVLTLVILVGGPLQLVPAMRRRFPAGHRLIGRAYLIAVLLVAGGGAYMTVTRGSGWSPPSVAVMINAALIFFFVARAFASARARRFPEHRRWALRLFMASLGVWFFRIGITAWLLVLQRPVGFDPKTFRGPFLDVLAFAQFALPLAMLELYLRARDGGSPGQRIAVAGGLALATLLTATGVVGAAMMLWLPHL